MSEHKRAQRHHAPQACGIPSVRIRHLEEAHLVDPALELDPRLTEGRTPVIGQALVELLAESKLE